MPPKEILLGYEAGKHKKGDIFDKAFMRKLIDWFKDAINRHEDWKKFNFQFSPTESYEDMSGFYKEVEQQGYRISFQNVPAEKIDSFVDSGKLFLFQIYNKDFAKKAEGKKNLHTLYFENLFSDENMRDVVIKLNGEAELFFRPADSCMKIVTHKKGSVLVNRTTTSGATIPEDLYQEIYQFKNGMASSLSDGAKSLLESGSIVCKTATHDITKDAHFTRNTYLFHCSVTMNFKASEITGKKFNERVIGYLKDNPNIKIIGLDRGERHLIYLSLINQNGEIEMQKTLNVVEQPHGEKNVCVDYQEKLVQKECGWLFYIPAGYTSKIDPNTGFANLFVTKGLTNVEKKKDFFDRFDAIRYDSETDSFVFSFNYESFGSYAQHDKDFKKKWEVYTRGERIVFSKKERKAVTVRPTEDLKSVFEEFGIRWNTDENFIDAVQEIQAENQNARFFDVLLRSFNATLPIDADANGAYHIAKKGLYLLQHGFNLNEKGYIESIKDVDWFRFVQGNE